MALAGVAPVKIEAELLTLATSDSNQDRHGENKCYEGNVLVVSVAYIELASQKCLKLLATCELTATLFNAFLTLLLLCTLFWKGSKLYIESFGLTRSPCTPQSRWPKYSGFLFFFKYIFSVTPVHRFNSDLYSGKHSENIIQRVSLCFFVYLRV